MSVPTSTVTPSVRSSVREAVERAWVAAVASGTLPALPATPARRPWSSTGRRTRSTATSPRTSRCKLARRCDRSPLAIADGTVPLRPAREDGADSRDRGGTSPARASSTSGWRRAIVEAATRRHPRRRSDYGRWPTASPASINVEFVSANPTGPLTVGNARGAFVGDLLCRVLEAVGHKITREYYFNDFGAPGRDAGPVGRWRCAMDEPVPEDGYHGEYVEDLADELPERPGRRPTELDPTRAGVVGAWASERIRAGIERSLAAPGRALRRLEERELAARRGLGRSAAVEQLQAAGYMYEQDGALWFRSTEFGDDKDRVVIRSNGEPTYFASDIGYVVEKFSRGFDELIYIWGADHHGTVARLKNAAQALGLTATRSTSCSSPGCASCATARRSPCPSGRASSSPSTSCSRRWASTPRAGSSRSRAHTTGIDFDIELAKKQSSENPVYYVQYAHARISSILRKAADAGPRRERRRWQGALDGDDVALGLAKDLLRLPDIVRDAAQAARDAGDHHLRDGAGDDVPRLLPRPPRGRCGRSRRPLPRASRWSMRRGSRSRNTLALLGISAPDSM